MLLGRFTTRRPRIGGKTASFLVAVFALAAVLVPSFVFAQTSPDLGLNFATGLGLSTTDIRVTIGRIIGAFFAFLGIIAVVLILYAGFIWMTAGGNEEKISQAKKILINATIGLIIMMSAYAITAFLIRAITGQVGLPGFGGGSPQAPSFFISGGSDELGSGILEYHYPEPGQTGVPRNTKIAITFKKPLVLSTVIRGHVDGTEPEPSGTSLSGPLNTDNIKIIRAVDLANAPATGSNDAKFDVRHEEAVVDPVPTAKVTVVTDPDVGMQTLVITLGQPIGSPTSDENYRVAVRGGAPRPQDAGTPEDETTLGVQVWGLNASGDAYVKQSAFTKMDSDGGYFWTFTTNTTIDTTPPKITAIVPATIADPTLCTNNKQSCIFRNQVMQVWFSEAVDPTTASGRVGTGGGFNNIDFKAKCQDGKPCDFRRVCSNDDTKDCTSDAQCDAGTCLPTPATSLTTFSTVNGVVGIGNRYRTAEFLPSALCEGVVQNSCGEPVYCLPKNVELRMTMKAATVGDDPPQASEDNGIVDMVGNSLDGNGNTTAEGPAGSIGEEYSFNLRPSSLAGIKDTASALYFVGEDVDLVPPRVTEVDPPSREGMQQQDEYNIEDPQAGGPSKFPVTRPISVTWSKNMMVTSMRTGRSTDPLATITLDANECQKTTCTTSSCTCKKLDAPSFTLESTGVPADAPVFAVTQIKHRPFFTANELGYTKEETAFFEAGIPTYVPALRAKLKDDRQNCFYPSSYTPVGGGACAGLEVDRVCVGGDSAGTPCGSDSNCPDGSCKVKKSCCNLTAMGTYSCPP